MSRALAGRWFHTRLTVTDPATGASPPSAQVTCDGTAGTLKIRSEATFENGYARCSFQLPPDAAGRLLKATIGVKAGAAVASRALMVRVYRPTQAQ